MSNPALLPSNTLLIRLSPPGRTYCLPRATLSRSPSRPPSPNGHVSDPEVDTSNTREGSGQTITPRTPHVRTLFQTEEQEPLDHLTRGRGRHLREPAKTASWNDLVKCVRLTVVFMMCSDGFHLRLVNLHAVICETRRNLAEVERSVDLLIEGDLIQPLVSDQTEIPGISFNSVRNRNARKVDCSSGSLMSSAINGKY